MSQINYAFNPYFLNFNELIIEFAYRKYVLKSTIYYCRIAWGMIIFFGLAFAFLDPYVFPENMSSVLIMRIVLFSVATSIITISFFPYYHKNLDWSSFLFIHTTGIFCIYLTSLSDPSFFSPYFLGLFYALAGIFSTVGLGFRYSLFALVLLFFSVNLTFLLMISADGMVLILYKFFLTGMMLIVGFIAFMVEKISRKNFVYSTQLHESLEEVKVLSGLLPMYSHCKKIRGDKGYWNQIEEYLREYSELTLSMVSVRSVPKNCSLTL